MSDSSDERKILTLLVPAQEEQERREDDRRWATGYRPGERARRNTAILFILDEAFVDAWRRGAP